MKHILFLQCYLVENLVRFKFLVFEKAEVQIRQIKQIFQIGQQILSQVLDHLFF